MSGESSGNGSGSLPGWIMAWHSFNHLPINQTERWSWITGVDVWTHLSVFNRHKTEHTLRHIAIGREGDEPNQEGSTKSESLPTEWTQMCWGVDVWSGDEIPQNVWKQNLYQYILEN